MGGDAIKGYPPETAEDPKEQSEKSSDDQLNNPEFEERRKNALDLIGRGDNPISKEFEEKHVLQTIREMQQDMKILRSQVDETVNVLNKMQVGIVNKFDELKTYIMSEVKRSQTRP